MVETDITGYGRKMGKDANGIEGRIDDVVVLQGERMIKGTVPYRTLVPANSESAGGGANAGDYYEKPRGPMNQAGTDVLNPTIWPRGRNPEYTS